MSQGAYDMYCGDVRKMTGLILCDQGQVTPRKDLTVKQVGIPATEQALRALKNKQVANIILLGALIEITRIVSRDAMERALQTHVSERFRNLNLEALRLGIELGGEVHG